MSQITACGVSNTYLLSIPTVGDFRLGFEDFTLEPEESGQTVKIQANTNKDEVKLVKLISTTVKLWDIDKTTYEAIENFALSDMQNYLRTMQGSITLSFGGRTVTGCAIKGIKRVEPYFDNDQVERITTLELKIENPTGSYF